jgi:hypothetical protein
VLVADWTVILTALGSAGAAGASAILSARLGAKVSLRQVEAENERLRQQQAHERGERVRDRRVAAADEFVTDLLKAVNATRKVSTLVEEDFEKIAQGQWTERDSRAAAEAAGTIEVVDHRYPRVALLFGPKSPATVEAEQAIAKVRYALAELVEPPPFLDDARLALDSAEEHRVAFSDAALVAISEPD